MIIIEIIPVATLNFDDVRVLYTKINKIKFFKKTKALDLSKYHIFGS